MAKKKKKKVDAPIRDEDSFDPQVERQDELTALQSILSDEMTVTQPAPGDRDQSTAVHIKLLPFPSVPDENHCEALLEAHLPTSYPIMKPRLVLNPVRGLTTEETAELQAALDGPPL